ncbi:hypothetical protein ILUMI_26181 [Ignelater luminosus]|uniref:PIH1 domain-containing protein 1 n=1 Tax=Ignelater luminosus TaxID=2038154 RepID=A0A8K0C8H6_IGNLU|nr:hypothetical protein ILUMI_26181 [Ignelater luminosus]
MRDVPHDSRLGPILFIMAETLWKNIPSYKEKCLPSFDCHNVELPNSSFSLFTSQIKIQQVPILRFCIKTKEIGTETKVFINICQTDAIPPPQDITEEKLMEIWQASSDENTPDEELQFKVPMSIGEVRSENDKKGIEAKAVDVAINPAFFSKVEKSLLFRKFFMVIVFEGLRNKYQLHTTDDCILLKNRKVYGELQLHRIQQREIDQKMGKHEEAGKSVLDELKGNFEGVRTKPKIETISSVTYDENENKIPEYRLFKKVGEPNFLIGEFKLPNVLDSKELTLDIGEDRIILESKKRCYFLDIFIPCNIIQDDVASTFNKSSKILTITMPIKLA